MSVLRTGDPIIEHDRLKPHNFFETVVMRLVKPFLTRLQEPFYGGGHLTVQADETLAFHLNHLRIVRRGGGEMAIEFVIGDIAFALT
jgi:hypothetical protein